MIASEMNVVLCVFLLLERDQLLTFNYFLPFSFRGTRFIGQSRIDFFCCYVIL